MPKTAPFETLIKEKDYKSTDKWYPTDIGFYKGFFDVHLKPKFENDQALVSNLAYNMQYLEYLEKQMTELNLSSVVETMCQKSYIITGMSIVEGIFVCIVKANNWWKTSCYESAGSTKANPKSFGGQTYIIQTELLVEVPEYPLQMTLDELINRLDSHHTALGVHHLVYPQLRRLKDLRNRVHLQKNDSPTDHDYNAFNKGVKDEMKSILYQIMEAISAPTPLTTAFDFLK